MFAHELSFTHDARSWSDRLGTIHAGQEVHHRRLTAERHARRRASTTPRRRLGEALAAGTRAVRRVAS
jgi:hypothetical protein